MGHHRSYTRVTPAPRSGTVVRPSSRPDIARKIARDFGIPLGVSCVDEVLAIDVLDAVVISFHGKYALSAAKAALEHGLHVLIEKPMTLTATQAKTLVDLADEQGVQFLISGPWHYTEHAVEARRLIQSGAIGDIKMISVLMTNFCLGFFRGLPWEEIFADTDTFETAQPPYLKPEPAASSDPAVCGGGQIYNQVSHVGGRWHFSPVKNPLRCSHGLTIMVHVLMCITH